MHIHDPDDHEQQALDEAFPALDELRSEGVIGAIGAGMNQTAMLARFARQADFDVFLLAGRYTLLDQGALDELFPACLEEHVAIIAGGTLNSGILAGPRDGATYDYAPAPPELLERARRLEATCAEHGVPLAAAALQFPLAHPAVATVLVGVRTPEELELGRPAGAPPDSRRALGGAPRGGPDPGGRADAVAQRTRRTVLPGTPPSSTSRCAASASASGCSPRIVVRSAPLSSSRASASRRVAVGTHEHAVQREVAIDRQVELAGERGDRRDAAALAERAAGSARPCGLRRDR